MHHNPIVCYVFDACAPSAWPEGASVSASVIAEGISEHFFMLLLHLFDRQSYIRGPAGERGSEAASGAAGAAE